MDCCEAQEIPFKNHYHYYHHNSILYYYSKKLTTFQHIYLSYLRIDTMTVANGYYESDK